MVKHRHSGPKVRYRTKKNNIRHRERPSHPKTGSWISKKFIHGPRQRNPDEFKNMYTVNQHWAKRRGLDVNPPDEESKVVAGTLKNGKFDVQSYITPLEKYKKKDYNELKKKFGVLKYGDTDKDGVPNYRDSKPFDKDKQSMFSGEHMTYEGYHMDEDMEGYTEEMNMRMIERLKEEEEINAL